MYRKLIDSSFADLQNPQFDLDGKAYAAVGQSGLMAIYDTLLSQLFVVCVVSQQVCVVSQQVG